VLWGAAGTLVIVVNGARLFNSYFIQLFAPLSLLAAWFLVDAVTRPVSRRAIAGATLVLMAALLVTRHYPARVFGWAAADVDALRGRMPMVTHLERFGGYDNQRGYSARANFEVAQYVRDHTTPDERIFLFGINGAGIYFASDRLTAQRFLRVNFFVATDFPDPAFRLDAVVAELRARRPRYVIFERLNARSEMGQAADRVEQEPVVTELLSAYRRDIQIEDFTLYRRTDAVTPAGPPQAGPP
jgi:hypothetical protein